MGGVCLYMLPDGGFWAFLCRLESGVRHGERAGWWGFFARKRVAGACHKRWRCVLIDGRIPLSLIQLQVLSYHIKSFDVVRQEV